MGIYKNNKGKVFLDDMEITNLSITDRAKAGIVTHFKPPRFKGMNIEDLLKISSDDTS